MNDFLVHSLYDMNQALAYVFISFIVSSIMLTTERFSFEYSSLFLSRLKQLDVQPIVKYLMHLSLLDVEQIDSAIEQYQRFLCSAYLYPDRVISPTQEVDIVWHCHILQTQKYRQDCQMLFGYYLDHEPLRTEAANPSISIASIGLQPLQWQIPQSNSESCPCTLEEWLNSPAACGRPTYSSAVPSPEGINSDLNSIR